MQLTQSLKGTVRTVIKRFNPNFVLVSLETENKERVMLIGPVPDSALGSEVETVGEFRTDPKWGRKFYADHVKITKLKDLKSIETYLVEYIDGIGKSAAKKLVRHFGRQVGQVIESFPQRLQEAGLKDKTIQRIQASWAEHRRTRQIESFLIQFGVKASGVRRVLNELGENAVAQIEQDPYILMRVHGYGFETADRMARQMGWELEDPRRIDAILVSVLYQICYEAGHCYLPWDFLAEKACVLGAVSRGPVEKRLQVCVDQMKLVVDKLPDGNRHVYLPQFHRWESKAAEHLFRLSGKNHPVPNLDNKINAVEAKLNIVLNAEQRQAIHVCLETGLSVLNGGPGTGKTSTLRATVEVAQQLGKTVILTAPTGRAAKRIEEVTGTPAQTIHRLLEYERQTWKRNRKNPLNGDLVIIDEFSMVDLELAFRLFEAIPQGCSVLIVGDFNQLPSVGPGRVLRDIIDSSCVPVIQLRQVYRQKETSRISEHAHQILHGKIPSYPRHTSLEQTDSLLLPIPRGENSKSEDTEKVRQTVIEWCKQEIPSKLGLDPIRDIQVLVPMRKDRCGVIELNKLLQSELNPRGSHEIYDIAGRQFRIGDRVIVMKNNYDRKIFNGDIGWVESVELENKTVTIEFYGKPVQLTFQELDSVELAYAQSVHKSQGSEYKAVVFVLLASHYVMLQRNLVYTAVTRAREACVLVSSMNTLKRAIDNNEIQERYSGLRRRIRELKKEAVHAT